MPAFDIPTHVLRTVSRSLGRVSRHMLGQGPELEWYSIRRWRNFLSASVHDLCSHYTVRSDIMAGPPDRIRAEWGQISYQLMRTMGGLVNALNTRTFTLDNPLVREAYDPNFCVTSSPYFWSQSVQTLEDYVKGIQQMNKTNPNWSAQNTAFKDVICIDDTHANAISSIEVHNIPDGIIRQVMTLFKFHLKDGKWRIYTTEALAGFEPNEGSGIARGPTG